MESIINKLFVEYKNKKTVYYNTELAKEKLDNALLLFKKTLNNEQLKLFSNLENLNKLYENEIIIEVFYFILDYIKIKFDLK